MAIKYNSVDNANLSTSLGGAPANGDSIYITYPWEQNYTAGVDLTGGAVDLVLATFGRAWKGGTVAGSPIKLVVNTGAKIVKVEFSGKDLHLESSSGSGVIYTIEHDPAANGKLWLGNCDNEQLNVRRGVVQVAATGDVENADVMGGEAIFLESGPQMTLLRATADGKVQCGRDVVTMTVEGRAKVWARDPALAATTVNMYDRAEIGGYLGDIGTLNSYGGVLDLTKVNQAWTLTTWNIYGPHEIRVSRSGPPVTIPTPTVERYKQNIVYV